MRRYLPHDRAGCSGATLIDLMLAVTIMGIFTAMAVQTFDTDEMALDAMARAIVADLYESQSLAIRNSVELGVDFDPSANRSKYVLADGSEPATKETQLKALPSADAAEVDELVAAQPSGVRDYGRARMATVDFAGTSRLMFRADGAPVSGGYLQVALNGKWLRIRVQDATGRITITGP